MRSPAAARRGRAGGSMAAAGDAPAGAASLAQASAHASLSQRFGTAVPRQGLSPAGLRVFVAQHAGSVFLPAEEELAVKDAPAPVALRFEQLTTFQVVARVIKPETRKTASSYAELLQQQVRRGGRLGAARARG